jgi:hypothetical protein
MEDKLQVVVVVVVVVVVLGSKFSVKLFIHSSSR